ncbi:lactate utilization protein [Alicyclobacillus fastidiosus]|uniref:Lactate utilization protein n=1 Tax=Alicyclobacillus fastidiosus TaxID=392011 RepID=A0ABY6ZNA2_9BACL|nr:lactate utilization protein [Alicyclobacillus fastidiosus]WAH44319.1 lactate utilization protein [Alicyclobacillus fastidiosus]
MANVATRLGRTLGAPPSPRPVVGVPEFWAQRSLAKEALVARFTERFTALAGDIEFFDTEAELLNRLDGLILELSPRQVGAWGRTADWRVDVEPILAKWSALRFDETTPHEFADVQVGITGCMCAIADTGTIVMTSDRAKGRGTHVLPLVHIVVMTEDQVYLRLGEVFPALPPDRLPASVHFVSGPSRSSDIENDQSIGVHGPARVTVLMLKGGKTTK